ncbi:MAG: DUF1593 domain-containing protein [Clostridia bacterium]|nr:DUF1593 domain-containing protein [Clostridia bacterium]
MEKTRLIVLTDIGAWDDEPDDAQSLVRLLLYSNEYDIEGIITSASWCHPDTSDAGYVQRVLDVINAYERVRDNLLVHKYGYPTAEHLRSVVKRGTDRVNIKGYEKYDLGAFWNMSGEEKLEFVRNRDKEATVVNVGEGKTNDGSRLIERAIEKEDPRGLYIALWGGCGALAQAIFDMEKAYEPRVLSELLSHLTVYDIDGQDDCGAWICSRHPEIDWRRSDTAFWGFSETPIKSPNLFGKDCFVGDLTTTSPEWIRKNMQEVGAMGGVYPMATNGMETDTPSILNLIHNGLSDYRHPEWGGWGGRFTRVKSQNVPAEHFGYTYLYEKKPYLMHRDDVDSWYDGHNGCFLNKSPYASVCRWRWDVQNDFAARMLWTVNGEFPSCNHNPVAAVNGDCGSDMIFVDARAGDTLSLDASESYDPDGDALSYKWYIYREAGTYFGEVSLFGADAPSVSVRIPENATNDELHLILEVSDNGTPFPLKSYRRIIIKTGETGFSGVQKYINDTEFEYEGKWEHLSDQYGSHDADFHRSNEKGARATLTFTGNRIMLFGGAFRSNGIAKIYIDGNFVCEEDFHSRVGAWENKYRQSAEVTTGDTLQFTSPYLPDGEHTLTVEVSGDKSCQADNSYIIIDKAVVFTGD